MELPCDKEGAFTVSFSLNGKFLDKKDVRPISFNVFDTSLRLPMGGEIKRTLIQEIDCATTVPDFSCGETHVIRKPFGAYRESGDKGWLAHMNAIDPSWFAYNVKVPEKQMLYQVEVDYPDDALRTLLHCRPGGVGCLLSNGWWGGQRRRILAHESDVLPTLCCTGQVRADLRIIAIQALDGRRAAASKIRIYKVDGELPLLETPIKGGRSFGNWYEEGGSMLGLYVAPDRSMAGMLTSADRWASTIRHMGGNTLWFTTVVYQFALYPSDYNVQFTNRQTADLVRAVLMACERYGMDFVGEFAPEARELAWATDAEHNNLVTDWDGNKAGRAIFSRCTIRCGLKTRNGILVWSGSSPTAIKIRRRSRGSASA